MLSLGKMWASCVIDNDTSDYWERQEDAQGSWEEQ